MHRAALALLPLLLLACGEAGDDTRPDPPGPQDRDDGGTDSGVSDGDDGGTTDGGGDDGGGGDGGGGDGGGGDDGGGDGGGGGDDGGGGDTGASGDDCPEGVTCVTDFPATLRDSTTGAASDRFDTYACAPDTDESGPEVLYRVTLPTEGFLALELDAGMASGTDIDVHLLGSRDADDCIDRGHWRAGALLDAGDYWVVADSWVSGTGDVQDGDYTLRMGFTSADGLVAEGMDRDVAEDALHAYDVAWFGGDADHFAYAITDFSLHAGEKRQWVLDMATGTVEWHLYIPHGEGSASSSDPGVADTFSNVENSHQSSLGMMAASETYTGSYGYSMRLDGLEPGYNDNVRSRAIVVHPWTGSRDSYVATWGQAANTWGCPAVDDRVSADVIDFLADGGLLFFHHPDGDWSRNSSYLP